MLVPLGIGLLLVIGGSAWARQTQQQQAQQPPAQAPSAQQQPELKRLPQSPATISVETKLVTVYATARDKKGKIVANLNKEDFKLDEDGQPQTISHFVRDTDVPLTLGLLVDTSYSQRGSLDDERKASYTFLDHMLRDKDRAFVIHFDREVELLQDLTPLRPKLQAALQLLDASPRDTSSDDDQSSEHRHAGTLLYDAIYLASDELMKKQQGRKALFVLTDGVDHGSRKTLEDAVEAAQRSDTLVYSILFPGVEDDHPHEHHGGGGHGGWGGMGGGWPGGGGTGWPGGGGNPGGGGPGGGGGGGGHRYPEESHEDGKKVLDRISTQTGGRLFEVSKKLPVDQIYAAIEEELRSQYSLGYSPSPADTGAGYHKIHLTTTANDVTVQARDGYYTDR
jgi:VWFA-related protein